AGIVQERRALALCEDRARDGVVVVGLLQTEHAAEPTAVVIDQLWLEESAELIVDVYGVRLSDRATGARRRTCKIQRVLDGGPAIDALIGVRQLRDRLVTCDALVVAACRGATRALLAGFDGQRRASAARVHCLRRYALERRMADRDRRLLGALTDVLDRD